MLASLLARISYLICALSVDDKRWASARRLLPSCTATTFTCSRSTEKAVAMDLRIATLRAGLELISLALMPFSLKLLRTTFLYFALTVDGVGVGEGGATPGLLLLGVGAAPTPGDEPPEIARLIIGFQVRTPTVAEGITFPLSAMVQATGATLTPSVGLAFPVPHSS